MEKVRVLIANEPRMYREAITGALRELRPYVEVSTIEPDRFEGEVSRLRPHLVVCSRITPVALAGILTWVELYPDGENRAEVITAGERAALAGVRFADFLTIVDEAVLLVSGVSTDGHRGNDPRIRATTNGDERSLEEGS